MSGCFGGNERCWEVGVCLVGEDNELNRYKEGRLVSVAGVSCELIQCFLGTRR